MRLRGVTFTGADDTVAPRDLLHISRHYPWVEWGILFSRKRQGSTRYPSVEWLSELHGHVALSGQMPLLSAHLCGAYVREALCGRETWREEHRRIAGMFARAQLNFHGERTTPLVDDRGLLHAISRPAILQCDGENDPWIMRVVATQGDAVPLFDRSHGAGASPREWPTAWNGVRCGYAGGLGPDNVAEEIVRIEAAAGDAEVWIDMETKVRSTVGTRDAFDLGKVVRVIHELEPRMRQEGA